MDAIQLRFMALVLRLLSKILLDVVGSNYILVSGLIIESDEMALFLEARARAVE